MNRSIWPIDGTLTSITTLGHSEPGSNGNEGVLQSSKTWASILDVVLVLYPGKLFFGGSVFCRGYSQGILSFATWAKM